MPRLLLTPYRTRLPRGLIFALRAREFERALTPHLDQDLYLELFHEGARDYLRRTRGGQDPADRLLRLAFNPAPPAALPEAPWHRIPGARVVFGNAHAFAAEELRAVGSRAVLADAMAKVIGGHVAARGFAERWTLALDVTWQDRTLRCREERWAGLRALPPRGWDVQL